MKARYDPQNNNRVIFQNTNYVFAVAGGIFILVAIFGLIFIPGLIRLGALLFAVFGFLFLAFADFNQIIVDGQAKTMEIRRRTLFKQSSEMHPLDEFRAVGLQSERGDSGALYRIAFFKKSGGAIPINDSYDNFDLPGKQKDLAILSDLAQLPIINA